MAPGAMPPWKRLPMTRSCAGAQLLEERHQIGEVVAVVGVAHDRRSGRARLRSRRAAPRRSRARATGTTRAPSRRRDLARAVGAAVVGDEDLAVNCRCRRGSGAPCGCTSASVSASLRHGIRMVSSTSSAAGAEGCMSSAVVLNSSPMSSRTGRSAAHAETSESTARPTG